MINDYKKRILSILINWYENSPSHVRGEKPSRRRYMRLYDDGQTDLPEYNIENHLTKKDINLAVLELAERKYIDYQWMRGQKNHIISKLWLKADAIESVYDFIGLRPKGDEVDELISKLTDIKEKINTQLSKKSTVQWALNWLDDTITVISHKRSIGNVMPELSSDRDDLLKAIFFLAANTEIETLERVFSMRCYGNSKHFECTIRKRLIRILKKYLVQNDCTDEEALRYIGIVNYPEQFSFSGNLSITLPRETSLEVKNGTVDFSLLPHGGTLTIDDINQGNIIIGKNIKRILSIENRANYIDYVYKFQKNDELVIYHGGHFSPAKHIFFQSVVSSMPQECVFLHWGDIDYGGFLMLARLRRKIYTKVKPWKMDKDDLIKFNDFTSSFPETYKEKLISLLEIPELNDCFPCIRYMLKSCVRLEQEAMLI